MIFLGNDLSYKEVEKLHTKLDEAIEVLGGLQQPPMSTMEIEDDYDIIRTELEIIVKDIVNDLGCEDLLK